MKIEQSGCVESIDGRVRLSSTKGDIDGESN
jgi:hypothetical protein